MAYPVKLALYDLSMGMAAAMSMQLIGKHIDGIWHTGIIVYNKEYFYGGGLQCMPHEEFIQMHGGNRPARYIDLGHTDIPEEVFNDFVREISPRFTQASYNLMTWNCNNFTDQASNFLLSKGIPEFIVKLPEEVLTSPGGAMLRPILEQMTGQMNSDPFGHALPPAGGGRTAAAAAAPALSSSSAAAGRTAAAAAPSHPILDANTKPLLSNNSTAALCAALVTRVLGAFSAAIDTESSSTPGSGDNGGAAPAAESGKKDGALLVLTEGERDSLAALGDALCSSQAPLPPSVYSVLLRAMQEPEQQTKAKLEMPILCLVRLMVLHAPHDAKEDESCKKMLRALLKQTHNSSPSQQDGAAATAVGGTVGFTSDQNLAMAHCVLANAFGRKEGTRFMVGEDMRPLCLEAALRDLRHARQDVRQLAAAVLHNYTVDLYNTSYSSNRPAKPQPHPLGDESTQLLFSTLDGVEEEEDDLVLERRLLVAGMLLQTGGVPAKELVREVGLESGVRSVLDKRRAEGKGSASSRVAAEVLPLIESS